MDTGIGDRENTGRHLHPATKVCFTDQMARPPDQHQSVSKQLARVREASIKVAKVCPTLFTHKQLHPTTSSAPLPFY